ncbi:MAG: peptidylprolyl isomerase [Bryobacteraceae bacterium]
MKTRSIGVLCLFLFLPVTLWCQTVRFRTTLGDIDVTLLPDSAPLTVENFLRYVNRGAYNNSIIHRSVPGFIFQGGGYQFINGGPAEILPDAPVRNEFRVSNTRGTLAMAKLGGNPNSATNQWFFNLVNNSANLDGQNGGFTVFGRVADAASLAVMDRIAGVSVFDELPLVNYRGGQVLEQNLVLVRSIDQLQLEPRPAISENGVITASAFGGFLSAAPGSYIEIYGSNMAEGSRSWSEGDFTDGNAPTSLDEVRVTVNGEPAYVTFISPTQVNVQIPANVPSSGSVPVIVSYKGNSSEPVSLAMKPLAPGLLAPPSFKVEDKQYLFAVHAASGAFVSNGNVPGLEAAPAVPGETLVLYGVGFGPVSPSGTPIAGQVAQGLTTLSTDVQIKIGESAARIVYSGLAPSLVGVYQFNVIVPADAPNGDLPLQVVVGGENIPQTLYIPVQSPAP